MEIYPHYCGILLQIPSASVEKEVPDLPPVHPVVVYEITLYGNWLNRLEPTGGLEPPTC
jgi:hypothetical protein